MFPGYDRSSFGKGRFGHGAAFGREAGRVMRCGPLEDKRFCAEL
jgi:hypothetical protein